MMLATGTALLVAAPAPSFADIPAVSVAGTATNLNNPPFTLGYTFSTSTSFKIDGLGLYDQGNDGLVDSHDIGLWDSGGNLLASATVDAGTTDSLINGFRFVSIAPVTIAAGTYSIGALFLTGNDPNFFGGDGTLSSISGFTYLSSAYAGGGMLSDPTTLNGGGVPAYVGPNLLVASVPEPASWAMLLLGCGLVGATLRARPSSVRLTYA
jgi:hypothetical protein